jgi:hypothetical protein
MDKDQSFPEQSAPLKNTDDAFVQVGADGAPQLPESDKSEERKEETDRTTTLDKR